MQRFFPAGSATEKKITALPTSPVGWPVSQPGYSRFLLPLKLLLGHVVFPETFYHTEKRFRQVMSAFPYFSNRQKLRPNYHF
jgi:hypothetical protein